MKKLFLILSYCIYSISLFSQIKDNTKKTDRYEDVDVDDTSSKSKMFPEAIKIVSSEIKGLAIAQANKNDFYYTLKIYGDYEWIFENNDFGSSNKFGILYKRAILFPLIFNTLPRINTSERVQLGIDFTFGVFNLETRNWEIPMVYEKLLKLNDEFYLASQNGKFGIIDKDNKIIADFEWSNANKVLGFDNYLIVKKQHKPIEQYGIYSISEAKLTVPCVFESLIQAPGKLQFRVKKEHDRYTIDQQGNVLIPADPNKSINFKFGKGKFSRNADKKFNYFTKTDSLITTYEFDDIKRYVGNLAVFMKDNKYGILKAKDGSIQEIVSNEYDHISAPYPDRLFVVIKEKDFGLMSQFGKKITDLDYDNIQYFAQGLFLSVKKNHMILLDKKGNELCEPSFVDILKIVNKENEKPYKRYNKFNYIMTQGENGKFGILDKSGKELVPPRFDEITHEAYDLIVVKENGKYGLFHATTKQFKIQPTYDYLVINRKQSIGFKENTIYKITNQEEVLIGKF